MMIIVKASNSEGKIRANPSKSYMQRAVAAAGLCQNSFTILNPSLSDDGLAALAVVRAMGHDVNRQDDRIYILKNPKKISCNWSVGESGLSARMFGVIAALFNRKITLNGRGSLLLRPMVSLEQALAQLKVKYSSQGGKIPFDITGPIKNNRIKIDGSAGSQVLTGLLMALPLLSRDSVIEVDNLKSKTYIDMTLDLMRKLGIRLSHVQYKLFKIPGNQYYTAKEYSVEGDWSGAAFLLVAGAVSGGVELQGLNPESVQGDRQIMEVLEAVGAGIEISSQSIIVRKNELNAFEFDATDTPDLFPPLAVLAANCKGISRIKGISRLIHKESNRYEAIRAEFGRLGIKVAKDGDWMTVQGGKIGGGEVFAHSDHRMAMALAILAMNASDEVRIDGMEAIDKSYPTFLEDFKAIGAEFTV